MTDESAFYYDADAAEDAVAFFRECLVHVKGEKAGQPLELDGWQADRIIRPLFGWKRTADRTRRYRTVYVEIPRKNGKSTLGAGLALILLCADGEEGAEVYSAASDKEQAAIVFEVAKSMRARSPELRKRLAKFKNSLVYHAKASTYKVLSADAETKHGFNTHANIFDELHAQPNRKLFDVLTTSTGARRQPVTIFLTTAGYDRHSICWEVHDYAAKVRDGIIDDPSFLPVIFSVDKDEPWDDPKIWALANPGLGSSVKIEYLEEQAVKARASLAYQNTFRRLHLNQWTEQAERALDMSSWDRGATPVSLDALKGRACYAGLDLASTSDLAALILAFPPEAVDGALQIIARFWVPAENVRKRVTTDRVPYDVWIAQGLITATPGDQIDYEFIRAEINRLHETVEIKEISYDKWGAVQLATQLEGDGFTMIPLPQTFGGLAPATKELLKLVAAGKIAHGGNPVLRWNASNLSVKQDAAGNLKPDKATSGEKIDGIAALVDALDRVMRNDVGGSVYERRGLVTV